MFFARDSVTKFVPDEYWYETLEVQLEEQVETFMRF